jgi:hypothetical protein
VKGRHQRSPIKMRKILDYRQIEARLREVIPPTHIEIYLRKTFLDIDCAAVPNERHILSAIDFINSHRVDYICVSQKTYFNQSILARKIKGYSKRVISVCLNERVETERDLIFDKVLHLKLIDFLNVIQHTNVTIFSQGWLFRYAINVAIDIFKGRNKHFLDVMDLGQLLFPNVDIALGKKMQILWGEDAIPNHNMQVWSECYLFKHADRCYFPGSLRHVYTLRLDAAEINKKYFVNHPIDEYFFCSSHQSKDLVFAGGIPTFERRKIPEFFGDAQLVTTIQKIYSNFLPYQLDVYNNPLLARREDYQKFYAPHFELMARYPPYRFLFGMEGREIRKKLSSYKFGLMIYDFEGNQFGKQHFTNLVPTKMYLYLEAGIPIIISEELEEAAKIVTQNKVGLKIAQDDLVRLEPVIKRADYETLRANVLNFRNKLYNESLKQLAIS